MTTAIDVNIRNISIYLFHITDRRIVIWATTKYKQYVSKSVTTKSRDFFVITTREWRRQINNCLTSSLRVNDIYMRVADPAILVGSGFFCLSLDPGISEGSHPDPGFLTGRSRSGILCRIQIGVLKYFFADTLNRIHPYLNHRIQMNSKPRSLFNMFWNRYYSKTISNNLSYLAMNMNSYWRKTEGGLEGRIQLFGGWIRIFSIGSNPEFFWRVGSDSSLGSDPTFLRVDSGSGVFAEVSDLNQSQPRSATVD